LKKWLVVLCVLAPAWVLTLLLPGAGSTPAQAVSQSGTTFLLEAEGFQGEATNSKFSKGAIDVLAWSWGASNSDARSPNFQDISFTKYIDRTSPSLLEALGTGQTIPSAKLHVIRSGDTQQEYLRLCFTGLHVRSISSGGSSGEDRLTENVSFSYDTIVQRYQQQKPDGTLDQAVEGSWDTTKNQKGSPAAC